MDTLLKDTPNPLTMAIVENNCLECNAEYGHRGTWPYISENGKLVRRTNGYPCPSTGVRINERFLKDEGIEKVVLKGTTPY